MKSQAQPGDAVEIAQRLAYRGQSRGAGEGAFGEEVRLGKILFAERKMHLIL